MHSLLYELEIGVWKLNTAVSTVDICLFGVNIISIPIIINFSYPFAIVVDVVHENSPFFLADIAKEFNLSIHFIILKQNCIKVICTKCNVMLLILKIQCDKLAINLILLF